MGIIDWYWKFKLYRLQCWMYKNVDQTFINSIKNIKKLSIDSVQIITEAQKDKTFKRCAYIKLENGKQLFKRNYEKWNDLLMYGKTLAYLTGYILEEVVAVKDIESEFPAYDVTILFNPYELYEIEQYECGI